MFTSAGQIRQELEGILTQPGGLTGRHWDSIITRCQTKAYWSIVNAFMVKGYLKSQVDQWDRGAEFEKDLALFFCLSDGKATDPEGYDKRLLDTLNRLQELGTGEGSAGNADVPMAVLTINGLYVSPTGTLGLTGTGEYDTSGDLFVPDDPDDSRIGSPMRF